MKSKILSIEELRVIYELLDEYSNSLDKLLGDEKASQLYNIYIKLKNRFEE